jgi:glycine/D-amino acid oxidase-like deaminating enzyme
MSFSHWEKETWFKGLDLVVIGSGLVGLSTALHFKKSHPASKVLVLERGSLPYGASTKNAGFACYGSPSELMDDLQNGSHDEVYSRVEQRYKGFSDLLSLLGANKMGYEPTGGFELFRSEEAEELLWCRENLETLNVQLKSIFPSIPFEWSEREIHSWGFAGIHSAISLPHEGQIDTGKTMLNLLRLCLEEGILILNGFEVIGIHDIGLKVEIETTQGVVFSQQLAICTNGFAQKLLKRESVIPARAQVFVSEEMNSLAFKGIFHIHKGYYYFRNVGNRLLLGGGRHLFKAQEQTFNIQTTASVQRHLKQFASKHIFPNVNWEIADSWAGIMGFGGQNEKGSLVKAISDRVVCGVRLGGMGIAIGSEVGRRTAELLNS